MLGSLFPCYIIVACLQGMCAMSYSITASIKDLFLGRIQYSENGTTQKAKEIDTYMLFGDYLEECKGRNLSTCLAI